MHTTTSRCCSRRTRTQRTVAHSYERERWRSSRTSRSICPRTTPRFWPRRLISTLERPGALSRSNNTTLPERPARAERPARWSSSSALLFAACADAPPRRPASGRKTWRTSGPKSRPRDRRDVVINTRGSSRSRGAGSRARGVTRKRCSCASVRVCRLSASPVSATFLGRQ